MVDTFHAVVGTCWQDDRGEFAADTRRHNTLSTRLAGKRVKQVNQCLDKWGYPAVEFEFDDGTVVLFAADGYHVQFVKYSIKGEDMFTSVDP